MRLKPREFIPKGRRVGARIMAIVVLSGGKPFISMLCCMLIFTGCFRSKLIPEERYNEANKLVDQGTKEIRAGKFEQAKITFSLAEDLAGLAAAVDGQGCAELLLGDFEQAEKLFRRAYQMDRGYDRALANLALLQDIKGNKEEAKGLYEQALQAFPDSAALRNNRAALEYELGESKMVVVDDLKKAQLIAAHPVVQGNLMRLGVVDKDAKPSSVPQLKKNQGLSDGVGTVRKNAG